MEFNIQAEAINKATFPTGDQGLRMHVIIPGDHKSEHQPHCQMRNPLTIPCSVSKYLQTYLNYVLLPVAPNYLPSLLHYAIREMLK